MYDYYKGKVAVVTGAASGFGLGFARKLLEYGVQAVWMSDYNEEALGIEAGKLADACPGRVFSQVADVSKREDVEALIARTVAESGRIDLLFNNAGKPLTKPTEDIPIEHFESLVQLNLMGVVYGTLAALPHLLAQGSGHVINTASCGGLLPAPYQAAYATTKAAVITFTRCLRYEYEERGLAFSQISPMNVATNIFWVETADKLRAQGMPEDEIARELARLEPPAGTMPLEEALDYIFEHIASRDVDIVLGQDGRDFYHMFCTDRPAFDEAVLGVGAARREFFEAVARGEDAVFPG